jgi:hypothetical protein
MPAPEDAAAVLAAVRLGWCMAEVRGRNRPDGPPGSAAKVAYFRNSHELPLQFERTPAESRIAAQAVLIALAGKLRVESNGQLLGYSQEVNSRARDLAEARNHADQQAVAERWNSLADLIYDFDAYIQDTLSVQSDMQAGGYQLGRALAEPYWALYPELPDNPPQWGSWLSLLGPERCDEIESLLGRLSAYMPSPYTARAIAGSVRMWQQVAASHDLRVNAGAKLYEQVCIWHELAALGRDPDTYIRAYQRLRNSRILNQAIRFFWGQIVLIAIGVASLVALVVLLGSGSGTAVVNTILSILAAAGVSTAGLSAGRFRRDLNTDLLTAAITKLPPQSPARP